MHCYDDHSGFHVARTFVDEQNSLPLKLRYKLEATGDFAVNISKQAQGIFDENAHYRSLCAQDRLTLFRNIVIHTGGIVGTFILHQLRLLHDPCFYQACQVLLGTDAIAKVRLLAESFDDDTVFVKLILAVLAFSTARHTVYDENAPGGLIDLKRILQIQDSYTDLAWRYMIYRYDRAQAVRRFSHLVRYLLRVNSAMAEMDSCAKHNETVGRVWELTEQMSMG